MRSKLSTACATRRSWPIRLAEVRGCIPPRVPVRVSLRQIVAIGHSEPRPVLVERGHRKKPVGVWLFPAGFTRTVMKVNCNGPMTGQQMSTGSITSPRFDRARCQTCSTPTSVSFAHNRIRKGIESGSGRRVSDASHLPRPPGGTAISTTCPKLALDGFTAGAAFIACGHRCVIDPITVACKLVASARLPAPLMRVPLTPTRDISPLVGVNAAGTLGS